MARKKQDSGNAVLDNGANETIKTVKTPKQKILTISGKRKTSIAKATIRGGNGEIRVNKALLETLPTLRKLYLLEPLRIADNVINGQVEKVNVDINVVGGGS